MPKQSTFPTLTAAQAAVGDGVAVRDIDEAVAANAIKEMDLSELDIFLRGITSVEAAAKDDQTGAEIKALYEAEANAFTDAQFTKLAGIEALADVTDPTNVAAAGALMESLYNANTIAAANVDNTPLALAIAEGGIVGRLTGGNIASLTAAQIRSIIGGQFEITAKTANFQIALAEKPTLITANHATVAIECEVPLNATVPFPVGSFIPILQSGAVAVTVAPETGGVTLTPVTGATLVSNGNPSLIWLFKIGTDSWIVGGDLVPTDASLQMQFDFALSDSLGTPLSVATGVGPVFVPRFDITILDAFAHLKNAGSGTGNLVVDINSGVTTIMSTNKINIEPAETDSEDATIQPGITTSAIVAGSRLSCDIDSLHSTTTGDGLVASILYRKT